jgi:hypothetical protein
LYSVSITTPDRHLKVSNRLADSYHFRETLLVESFLLPNQCFDGSIA